MTKSALIFGVTGQDGSWLAEFLLSKNYKVYGVARRVSTSNGGRLMHIKDDNFQLLQGDITDSANVNAIIAKLKPDEVYNLAAQSQVRVSFDEPLHTFDVTARGAFKVLEAIRQLSPKSRFYQAGSSEMFGSSLGILYGSPMNDKCFGNAHYRQDENTPFQPQSPYAIAKLAAHHMTKLYRNAYGLFACNGILFNHESSRRGEEFVSRKITKHLAKLHTSCFGKYINGFEQYSLEVHKSLDEKHIKQVIANQPKLKLGNTEAYRDWGHAQDFVEAMWLMLQQDTPDDYVIATGETHSVKEFLVTAYNECLGYYSDSLVETDPNLFRAAEVNYLCGNYSKAKKLLGWEPKVKFNDLVKQMLLSDINAERAKYSLQPLLKVLPPNSEMEINNDGQELLTRNFCSANPCGC